MQLLGFLRSLPKENGTRQLAVLVDWNKVDIHVAKVRRSNRIHLEADCLRWIPLLTQLPNISVNEETNDTSCERLDTTDLENSGICTSITPVAAMQDKVQRIKIRKKIRPAKRFGAVHRKSGAVARPKPRALLQKAKTLKIKKEVRK